MFQKPTVMFHVPNGAGYTRANIARLSNIKKDIRHTSNARNIAAKEAEAVRIVLRIAAARGASFQNTSRIIGNVVGRYDRLHLAARQNTWRVNYQNARRERIKSLKHKAAGRFKAGYASAAYRSVLRRLPLNRAGANTLANTMRNKLYGLASPTKSPRAPSPARATTVTRSGRSVRARRS